MKLVVAVTGASGAAYGVRLLEVLKERGVETFVVVSKAGLLTLRHEMGYSDREVRALASHYYSEEEMDAPIASGSFLVDGMVVAPCSTKTLACIAHDIESNLVVRAAMVALKERRPLLLLVRETPLTAIHLENMLRCARVGAIVMPASPSFYNRPKDVAAMVDQMVGRMLDALRIEHSLYRRWGSPETGHD
jgi:4-hydroxy-3-polyprenylbenzoate decarboxylase